MTSSPTPAVLPDTRALPKLKPGYPDYVDDADGLARFREQVRHGSGHDMAICNNNSLGRLIDTIERLRAERDALATPPARDAAVPAGFVLVPVEPTRAMYDAAYAAFGSSWFNFQRMYADITLAAAAPKVASDTGAGLREALRYLRDAADSVADRLNTSLLDEALAKADAALATPTDATDEKQGVPCERCQGNGEIVTDWDRYVHGQPGDAGDEGTADCPNCDGTGRVTDATDGATGGGEVEPIAAMLICDQTGGKIMTDWPVPWYREQEANDLYGDTGGYRIVPLFATTPGGDLLEQAARGGTDV